MIRHGRVPRTHWRWWWLDDRTVLIRNDQQELFMVTNRLCAVLPGLDLNTAAGRVEALRLAAPIVAGIDNVRQRDEWTRRLADDLRMEHGPVLRVVEWAYHHQRCQGCQEGAAP